MLALGEQPTQVKYSEFKVTIRGTFLGRLLNFNAGSFPISKVCHSICWLMGCGGKVNEVILKRDCDSQFEFYGLDQLAVGRGYKRFREMIIKLRR